MILLEDTEYFLVDEFNFLALKSGNLDMICRKSLLLSRFRSGLKAGEFAVNILKKRREELFHG
jgi:hypothetical protein